LAERSYLDPALVAGLIAMTRPETPRSSRQQYRLTDRGRELLAKKITGIVIGNCALNGIQSNNHIVFDKRRKNRWIGNGFECA
jgi:DNA-binding PadR family transcriptional regulator